VRLKYAHLILCPRGTYVKSNPEVLEWDDFLGTDGVCPEIIETVMRCATYRCPPRSFDASWIIGRNNLVQISYPFGFKCN
jgi:hypothetical protein